MIERESGENAIEPMRLSISRVSATRRQSERATIRTTPRILTATNWPSDEVAAEKIGRVSAEIRQIVERRSGLAFGIEAELMAPSEVTAITDLGRSFQPTICGF